MKKNMKNKNGFISVTLVYTFLILFLFVMLAILKTYSRNNKILTTFSERINNDLKVSNEQKSKLYYRILIDNLSYPDNVSSTNVSSTTGINFSIPSSSTNGQGLYYTIDQTKTINGTKVYYFRGNVNNNYVIYAGFCFRIVRTTEGNAVRMQYAGTPTNGSCPTGTITAPISGTMFNQTRKDNAFIGFRVGLNQGCENTTTCNATVPSTSYDIAHKGIADSNAKKALETWTQNNIYNKGDNVTKYLANTVFCNDRKITVSSEGYTGSATQLGYGNNTTDYDPLLRFNSSSPSFNCINDNDKYTTALTNGNSELLYPVALITMDELLYAGAGKTSSSTFYLSNGNYYYTMTPKAYKYNSSLASNDSYLFGLDANGILSEITTSTSGKLFPVITLRGDAVIESGTGLSTSPYVIGE